MKGCTPENFEKGVLDGWEVVFLVDDIQFFYERSCTDKGYHIVLYKDNDCILNEDVASSHECLERILSFEIFEKKTIRDFYDDMTVSSIFI